MIQLEVGAAQLLTKTNCKPQDGRALSEQYPGLPVPCSREGADKRPTRPSKPASRMPRNGWNMPAQSHPLSGGSEARRQLKFERRKGLQVATVPTAIEAIVTSIVMTIRIIIVVIIVINVIIIIIRSAAFRSSTS